MSQVAKKKLLYGKKAPKTRIKHTRKRKKIMDIQDKGWEAMKAAVREVVKNHKKTAGPWQFGRMEKLFTYRRIRLSRRPSKRKS